MTCLKTGTVVRIKSAPEIAATLDEDGTLGGLPFMPEMVPLCGRVAIVRRVAHKTCDSVSMRRLDGTVHLVGLHCDGGAHGGCQLGCSFFWREAWLIPADSAPGVNAVDPTLALLASRSTSLHGRNPACGTYACQATEIPRITTRLPWWSPNQYIRDVSSGNARLREVLHALSMGFFNGFQAIGRHILPSALRIRSGLPYPFLKGSCTRTPAHRLGLQPGELVDIPNLAEIVTTLDRNGLNRGLSFDWDMLPYCGSPGIVDRRVERIIDEYTGRLIDLANPCIVLRGVKCRGRYHQLCPRGQDSLWHEVWLRRRFSPDG